MEKIISVSGKECTFKSSAALPRLYRAKFGRDIFVDLSRLEKEMKRKDTLPSSSLEIFENIAYIMHKHGDPSQPSDIEKWLEQFDTFDVYMVLPELLKLWNIENITTSTAKKK